MQSGSSLTFIPSSPDLYRTKFLRRGEDGAPHGSPLSPATYDKQSRQLVTSIVQGTFPQNQQQRTTEAPLCGPPGTFSRDYSLRSRYLQLHPGAVIEAPPPLPSSYDNYNNNNNFYTEGGAAAYSRYIPLDPSIYTTTQTETGRVTTRLSTDYLVAASSSSTTTTKNSSSTSFVPSSAPSLPLPSSNKSSPTPASSTTSPTGAADAASTPKIATAIIGTSSTTTTTAAAKPAAVTTASSSIPKTGRIVSERTYVVEGPPRLLNPDEYYSLRQQQQQQW